MRLERIVSGKGQGARISLHFDDGSVMKVQPSVVADLALYHGQEFDEAALEQLRQAAGKASAKARAVRIISASAVSQRDLRRRLEQKGERPEDAEEAVAWLQELHLVDDRDTARQIVRHGVSRGYGAARIRQMLYEKQIPRELWAEVLEEIPDMSGAVDDFLSARFRGTRPDRKEIKRAADALARRGYSWTEIQAGLRRYDDGCCEMLEEE